MFQLSLVTIAAAFAVCLVIVIWMMYREARRERLRREEEHLAFAGVMANGIVHDFRNPMSSMRLDAQMLDREISRGEGCRPVRLSELAGRIRNTIDRLDNVFQEFLYVSKPPSTQRERVDLKACVRECLAMLRPRLNEAGVQAEAEMPADDVFVSGYQSSLQRALINVVINAEQFSARGSRITVRISREEKEAFVDVLDRGPGIPQSDRQRVFEMFYSSRPGGTGLGLFLARAAVERCGGKIKALNNPEGGACIRITLLCQNPGFSS
jgi:signal transduction histidine kinase